MKATRLFYAILAVPLCFAVEALGAVTVSVHPARAPLTLTQPQQFTATVAGATNHAVTWAVDGITGGNATVGTISSSGLYRPPARRGTHKITAKSVVAPGSAGSATVWITNYPGMFTYHADRFRSGVNLQELALSPATVNSSTFGKLFSRAVDGQIYAQPLYVANLTIAGAKHNVVYVATEHSSVYAFDSDGRRTTPFWKKSFINPAAGITTIAKPPVALISPEISISSTPVIDPATSTLYVSVSTREKGAIVHRLHALSLTSGAEKFAGPIVIQGSVPGAYPALAKNGRVPFVPAQHLQRPALLLLNGNVYIAYGSNGDVLPYNGWLFAYSAASGLLHQVAVFCASPNAGASAIWQSGDGPAADNSGNIYVATGNGPFDLNSGGPDAGNTLLKLSLQAGALKILDYFTPFNQASLTSNDLDFGAGGPLIPATQTGAASPSLIMVGGKDGKLYSINRSNMGKFNPAANQDVQTLTLGNPEPANGLFATPAVWNSRLYIGEINEPLGLFIFSSGLLSTAPAAQTSIVFGYPGTSPMVSNNGTGNGVVWTLDLHAYAGGTPQGGVNTAGPAILHAYDATNLHELYNSTQAGARDTAGKALKFTSPTVANGRVYVGTANELDVYGFLP
ncbi:MAG TPA: hypothetical protein VJN64_01655 [Terriglobales bacterium]|nr:hypothetical protein [Terriglobales bacterium]